MKEIAIILTALCGVLAVASVTGRVLQSRYAGSAAIVNLNQRVHAWWGIVFVLAAAAFAGPIGVAILFSGLAVLALREYLRVTRGRQIVEGLLFCVAGIACVPAVAFEGIPHMVFLLLVAQSNDVLQYIWGKLAGRHKLAPSISPSKTVEGLIGGVASATALGVALAWLTPFSTQEAAGAAFLIAIAGTVGGLRFSAIKREYGAKDWGDSIPGHGGVLDRLDSVCLSAPAFYLFLRATISA